MLYRKIISSKVIIAILLFFSGTSLLQASERRIFLCSGAGDILQSQNDGGSWISFNSGLPKGAVPVRFYTAGDDLYLATYSSGLFRLENDKWLNVSSDDFRRRSIYSKTPGYRKISAFGADPDNSSSLILATKHTLYRSRDRGKTWIKLSMSGLSSRNYITAAAISGEKVYAGTSFSGVFESSGGSFRQSAAGLPHESYSDSMKFTEQISFLHADKKNLYAGFQFGGGLYVKPMNSAKFEPVLKSEDNRFTSIIYDIKVRNNTVYFSDRRSILSKTDSKTLEMKEYSGIIEKISARGDISKAVIIDKKNIPSLSLWIENPGRKFSRPEAADKKAIYLSIPAVQRNLGKYLEMAEKTEINAFVIDMKDDFGNIYFPTENKTAKEINAAKKPVNLKDLLQKLKSRGIYSIARVVTFKDQKLFNGYGGKYSIKNRDTGAPWRGAEGEFWVDPYSEFVQSYNIELAVELEKAGFDEIQFDYIRFPSDGPVHLCRFQFQNDPDTYKSEILIDFLQKAKQSLNIPVSVDIYGFNSWYYFGNMIGQDMEDLSYTVDAICPMVYPSHFGTSFYKKYSWQERHYRIIKDGGIRAEMMLNKKALLRPYIQGFNLISPAWGPDYIKDQIKGVAESGCSGYTIWNAKGDYDVPYKALKENR